MLLVPPQDLYLVISLCDVIYKPSELRQNQLRVCHAQESAKEQPATLQITSLQVREVESLFSVLEKK